VNTDDVIRAYLREIAKKGGSVKGQSKRRGDKDYYSQLAKRRKRKTPETP